MLFNLNECMIIEVISEMSSPFKRQVQEVGINKFIKFIKLVKYGKNFKIYMFFTFLNVNFI